MKFQNFNYTIDCGITKIKDMQNETFIKISFNKKFNKPPVVAIGGSVGNVANGYSSGAYVSNVTTYDFTYYSSWEYSTSFQLHWIAIEI